MYDDPSERQRAEQQSEAQKRAALFKDYQRTFESKPGQVVLKNLVERFFMRSTVNLDNPNHTYYNEGQRAVVREIISILNMNVDDIYAAMRQTADE